MLRGKRRNALKVPRRTRTEVMKSILKRRNIKKKERRKIMALLKLRQKYGVEKNYIFS